MVLRWSVDRHRPGVTTRRHRKVSPVNLQELLDKQDSYDAPAVVAGVSAARIRSVATRGAVPVGPDSCFRIASLTKVFTCTALVKTMRDNSIPLGTPVIELLPDLAPGWRADVRLTIEQILGQVSGLRESVDSTALVPLGDGPHALQEAAQLVVGTGNEHEPGARWSYYNGNYILAGAVLAALSGTSYERALEKTLLGPWNLSRTSFDAPRDATTGWDGPTELPLLGYPRSRRPSGGLWSSVSDLLAVGEGLLSDRALLNDIRRPRTTPDDPVAYGLGWALGPSGQMYLNGRLPGYRAAMLLIPDKDYVSVVATNQQHALRATARFLSDMQHTWQPSSTGSLPDRLRERIRTPRRAASVVRRHVDFVVSPPRERPRASPAAPPPPGTDAGTCAHVPARTCELIFVWPLLKQPTFNDVGLSPALHTVTYRAASHAGADRRWRLECAVTTPQGPRRTTR
ncbi:beta-lactamase family protein [Streptomyces mirabilis]